MPRAFFWRGIGQVGIEPGAGERPPALCGGDGAAERGSGFRVAHAGKEAQLDQLGLGRLLGGEGIQGIVEIQQFIRGGIDLLDIDEGNPATTASVTAGRLAAGVVDQDEAHGFGGSGEEVATARELTIADQTQVRLMDQGCGVEGLAGLLLGQLLCRLLAQLVVDQRQQLLGGVRVTLLDGIQHPGDPVHHLSTPSRTGRPRRRSASALRNGRPGELRPGVAPVAPPTNGTCVKARAEACPAPHT
jgi:hypothetical protein